MSADEFMKRMTIYLSMVDLFELTFMLLTYLLGLGIVSYVGAGVNVIVGIMGFLVLFFARIGFGFLKASLEGVERAGLVEVPGAADRRRGALVLPFAFFGLSAAIVLGLLFERVISALAGAVVCSFFLVLFLATEPQWGRAGPGYRILLHAFVAGGLTPLAACAIQGIAAVQLLSALTFPLVLIYLAALIVAEFRTYAADLKTSRKSMVINLGWQNVLRVHQGLVAGTFLLVGLGPVSGLPWKLFLPAFLALPFAVVQMLWMGRIRRGGSTRWSFIVPLSKANSALLAYLLLMPLFLA
jgi:1,4-dihydroxy-2-naphthoate octaprenyltransferase